MLEKVIENKLTEVVDSYLEKNLLEAKAIQSITVTPDTIKVELALGYPALSQRPALLAKINALLLPLAEGRTLVIDIQTKITAHTGKQGIPGLPDVKNIIAVASGKGGVGKSTVAVNLALALAREGASVGLLDADVYGPSQPHMVGAANEKPEIEGKIFQPIIRHGIQTMSIGYLIDQSAALVWRGPMLAKALQQLFMDTAWQDLDYLVIDLPPGTGDIHLTLCQKLPVTGALIVTTPQDMALIDVRRACEMFLKLGVPIMGVVENMSSYQCSNCQHEEHIFGHGASAALKKEYQLDLLGSIPLSLPIREMTDSGNPPVAQAPESSVAQAFMEIARKASAKLACQTKDYSAKFPKIVVEANKEDKR